MDTRVIVYADKTVLKIRGLNIHGLRPSDVEHALAERLQTVVRVIGVTGSAIDMDVYGLGADALIRDEQGLLSAVAATPGIRATEIVEMSARDQVREVDAQHLPDAEWGSCRAQRWTYADSKSSDLGNR